MVKIGLGYSIRFKLGQMLHGQMLHGQMLTVQMSPRQLTTHTDGLTIKPSKFGWVLTSNIWDMDSYLLLNYRDPKNNNKKMNFENQGGVSFFQKCLNCKSGSNFHFLSIYTSYHNIDFYFRLSILIFKMGLVCTFI